jgi:anti-sigma regulatory factor (Ser/Thr protein kinase)
MPYYRCPACGSMSHSVAAYSTAGVCAVCSAELPAHAKLHIVPESRFGVTRSIRAGLGAPGEARRAVVALPLGEQARDRLALVVSELVTNAVRHGRLAAGDPIDLEMTSEKGRVWISVHDSGPGFSPAPHANGEGGFGLAIVAQVATEWGVDRAPDGCTVWCTVDAAAAESPMPMRLRA